MSDNNTGSDKADTAVTAGTDTEGRTAEITSTITEKTSSTTENADTVAADSAPEHTAGLLRRLRDRRPTSPRAAIAARAAVAVLLGAALACSGYFFLQDRKGDALLDAQQEAREAACKYAPVLADYDAKNLDPYFAAVLDGATGDWKKQFDDTSRELKEVLSQGEVVSKANDVQCAIKTGDAGSAEAIVVIGQTITSLGTQGKPAPGQLSMVMRLEKTDGRWLVNKVNSPLAGPAQP